LAVARLELNIDSLAGRLVIAALDVFGKVKSIYLLPGDTAGHGFKTRRK
jgi:hypothetical protein